MYGEGASLYSVLIVEDEPAVRRSLVNKIRWEEMGLAVTGTAQNAEEAYEIIKQTPPDIILLDMRMPGMGGLAFLNILNREFPDIKIIILSGHSDFDYVRHALRCGASDYLLKPIVKEDLRAALDKVIGAIREERDQNRRSTRNQMLLNESLPLLRNMLLNKLLTGIQMDREAVLRRLRFLGVELQFPWYVVAVIKIASLDAMKRIYMNDISLAFFALENVMNESIQPFTSAVGFQRLHADNEFVYIFGFNRKDGIREQLEELFRTCIRNIETYNKFTIHAAVSDPCDRLADLPRLYRSISFDYGKMKHGQASGVFFANHFYEEAQLGNLISVSETLDFINSIERDDKQRLMGIVSHWFRRLEKADRADLADEQRLVAKIYFCFDGIMERHGIEMDALYERKELSCNRLIASCRDREELKMGVIRAAVELAGLLRKKSKSGASDVIEQAIRYINESYFEDLTLGYVAEKFYLNPNYFSELFKKQTGECFSRYVNRVRIQKAKELLVDQKIKPAHVFELVGFHDPAYFSKVFKKMAGLTPTEYVKQQVTTGS